VLLAAFPAAAQGNGPPVSSWTPSEGIVREIVFSGLRRIAPATLRAHIASREGRPLDAALLAEDVRALDRLGWFDSIRVEAEPLPVLLADRSLAAAPEPASPAQSPASLIPGPGLRLVFLLEERPFLAKVEYRGSELLPRERMEALLAGRGIAFRIAAPVDRTALWRGARAIEAELRELGHPDAHVRVRLIEVPTEAVKAVFVVDDGPRVHVAALGFRGNRAFSAAELRKRMKRVAPRAMLAGLRDKTIYTPQRLGEDLERVLDFYRDHGYAEARLGEPAIERREQQKRTWWPWPRRVTRPTYQITVPVEEGPLYRLAEVRVEGAAARLLPEPAPELRGLAPQQVYSQERLLRARHELRAHLARVAARETPPHVTLLQQFDPEQATVRVTFRTQATEPYLVRRIEFRGHHCFSDRFFRRRLPLREGEPFDSERLEQGLVLLARGGFIKPIGREDVEVQFDQAARTASVAIRIEEIGRQRVSLVGGANGLGSTLGIVYNVFNLFGGEELITTHLEGGPESLTALLGVAKEGILGTRASLWLNLFHNVLRPRLPGLSGRERLFTSRSSGMSAAWSHPLTPRDTVTFTYEQARTSTSFNLGDIPALADRDVVLGSSRRAAGFGWEHDAVRQRFDLSADLSGGWLGGTERTLRSSLEYARLDPDPATRGRNVWGFRGYLAGVSSYNGTNLPLHSRFFPGEQLARGFRTGELTPYAIYRQGQADATPLYRVQSSGANLVAAGTTEYRIPLQPAVPRTELAAFFDAGSAWLLPRWLGPIRSVDGRLLPGTNGALRASTGLEVRWRVPGVNQTLRVHYAANPLRLAPTLLLADGSRFRPPDRPTALGWALGSFF
jgi:outer membrane protein insertion porin family